VRNVGLWILDVGLWSPEFAREETVVVAPACRQAGSLLCDGKCSGTCLPTRTDATPRQAGSISSANAKLRFAATNRKGKA